MSVSPTGGRVIVAGLFTVLLASCDASDRTLGPGMPPDPSFLISDGATSGNPNFYFLPPLVADPLASGTFDGTKLPEVVICHLVGEACGDIAWQSGDVQVDPVDELYWVNWQTDQVVVGQTYRIHVYSNTSLLGFADVMFPENKGQAKKLGDGDEHTFTLNDGRTMPVKFRIEEFAELTAVGCEPDGTTILDCDVSPVASGSEGSVQVDDPAGPLAAIVETPDIGVPYFLTLQLLPTDGYPAPADEIPEADQFPYFVRVTAVDALGQPVDFGEAGGASLILCQDEDALGTTPHEWLKLFRVDDGVVTLWPDDQTTHGVPECAGYDEMAMTDSHGHATGHGLLDVLLHRGKRTLASLLVAEPLYAIHGGLNGFGITAFSEWGATVVEPELPDLVVSSLVLAPTVLGPGDDLSYTFTLANQGAAAPEYPAMSEWDNRAYISTDAVLDASDVPLPFTYSVATYSLSETFSVTLTYTRPIPGDLAPGDYYLIYVVDAGINPDSYAGVTESNEDNNWRAAPFKVAVYDFQIDFQTDQVDERPVAPLGFQYTLRDWNPNDPTMLAGDTILVRDDGSGTGNRVVSLEAAEGTGAPDFVIRPDAVASGANVYWLSWRAQARPGFVGGSVVVRDRGSLILAAMGFTSTDVWYQTTSIGSHTPGAWQSYGMVLDLDNKQVTYYVAGTAVHGPIGFYELSAAPEIARISVELGSTSAQTFWWDDVSLIDMAHVN